MIEINFPPARERIDYRELRRKIDLMTRYTQELFSRPIRVLPDGTLDRDQAERELRSIGIDNATVTGTPFNWKIEPK